MVSVRSNKRRRKRSADPSLYFHRKLPLRVVGFLLLILIVLLNELVWMHTVQEQQDDTKKPSTTTTTTTRTWMAQKSASLQKEAAAAARHAMAERPADDACVTTFSYQQLPPAERGFLLFCAPPSLDQTTTVLPESMKSWQEALRGRGTFVVLTNDPQTRRVCRQHSIPVICTEHSDEGLPLLDQMFARMHTSSARQNSNIDDGDDVVVAYVNSDISVHDADPLFALLDVLTETKLEVRQPTQLYRPYQATGRTSDYWFTVLVRTDVDEKGQNPTRHASGGFDFWAWNTQPNGLPLLPFDVPPFRFPLASYDMWLLDMIIQSGQRNAIDATEVVQTFHRQHHPLRTKSSNYWYDALLNGVTGVFMNRYFAYNEPRASASTEQVKQYETMHHYMFFGRPSECPYRAVVTTEGKIAIFQQEYWSNLSEKELINTGCTKDANSCAQRTEIERATRRAEYDSSYLPVSRASWFAKVFQKIEAAAAEHWRYTLSEQLRQHATRDGFVLLTAVNFDYREHLMNFKCTLERVGMRDHFVVAAMDEKMYEWGIRRGLPIYLAGSARGRSIAHGSEFGGKAFRSVTKLKSVAVLEVLNAGYSVIWSDVDITWFKHPFDALAGFMKKDNGVIAIQSNAPYIHNPNAKAIPHETVGSIDETNDDPAARRRLNSGLYVAPNNPLVRSAFQEIVDHAATTKQSEQPSFDEVLCALAPSERGYSACRYRPHPTVFGRFRRMLFGSGGGDSVVAANRENNAFLHVETLDRFQFPSGAVLVGENNDNVYTLGREDFEKATGRDLYAAHNNWISGESQKKARQIASGWWFLSDDNNSCMYLGEV